MHSSLFVALFSLSVATMSAATAVLAEGLPDSSQIETDRVLDLTMRSAAAQMGQNQSAALTLMSKDKRADYLARVQADNRQVARSALAAGADASSGVTPAPALSKRETINGLRDTGVRNARAAWRLTGQAKRGEPPRYDEKGLYFSFAQTTRYFSSRWSERAGRFTPEFYDLLQCRRAVPMGLIHENTAWNREWSTRVCPDEQGLYRPTL